MCMGLMMTVSCNDPIGPDGREKPDNPDNPGKELGEAIDLNAGSTETANCYVVNEGGYYCFNATVMGNGDGGLESNFPQKTTKITPAGAKLVWSETKGLFDDISYKDGKIYFSVDNKDGNAVIAATDEEGTILWSWNIWSTEKYETVDYDYAYKFKDGTIEAQGKWTIMDRNLGSFGNSMNDGDAAYGNYYQWGRKDPFSQYLDFDEANDVHHTTEGGKDDSPEIKNTIQYSIEHPMTFLAGYVHGDVTDNISWINEDKVNNLWGHDFEMTEWGAYGAGKKTIYDPCPVGWKVAPVRFYRYVWDNQVAEKYPDTLAPYVYDDGGIDLAGTFFPSSGFIYKEGGGFTYVGVGVNAWTCSSGWSGSYGAFRIQTNDPTNGYARSVGCPVRCMKMD